MAVEKNLKGQQLPNKAKQPKTEIETYPIPKKRKRESPKYSLTLKAIKYVDMKTDFEKWSEVGDCLKLDSSSPGHVS